MPHTRPATGESLDGVSDGTRTHNAQIHNLVHYHCATLTVKLSRLFTLDREGLKNSVRTRTAELQVPSDDLPPVLALPITGAPGRTRTCGPQLRRLLLYPPELRAPRTGTRSALRRPVSRRPLGRGERIRTSGFLLPKQARYQAAPRPAQNANLYTSY